MYTSRIFNNEGNIIEGLRTIPGVNLVVQDLAVLSFEQQVRLIGNSSLIIGVHGKILLQYVQYVCMLYVEEDFSLCMYANLSLHHLSYLLALL